MTRDKLIKQFETLLAQERSSLVSSNFGELARLVLQKEKMFARLSDVVSDTATLRHLQGLIQRNEGLIQAAQQGLRAAQSRLAEVQRGAPMATYGANGDKAEFTRPVRTLHRRA